MNKSLPDKWIRKAIYDAINDMSVLDEVNSETIQIPCYDTRVTSNGGKNHYILMTTQTNSVDKSNKCENFWESSILLDIITSYNGSGNIGSRLLADNILDKARELTDVISLDVSSGLDVIYQSQDFPNDISTITKNENIYRKFMRIELLIK